MRRSLLFIPGNAPGMVQTADVFEADAVIFDLEDAVLPAEKDAARMVLQRFFHQFPIAPYETIVRINGIDTKDAKLDLDMCLNSRVDAIMVPKASQKTMLRMMEIVEEFEARSDRNRPLSFIPIIETTGAVFEAPAMAAIPRVSGLLFGGEDFTADLGVTRTESGIEILVPRSMVAMAAKSAHIDAIDTPFLEADQETLLQADALHAKSLGMNAKACIHPLQVRLVNAIFSPSEAELNHARKLVAAEEIARQEGRAAFSVDGKMVDKPVLVRAKNLLAQARRWSL